MGFPFVGGWCEKSSGFGLDGLTDHVRDLRPVHIVQFVAVRGLAARPQQVAEEPGVLVVDLLVPEVFAHRPVQGFVVREPQGGVPSGTIRPSVVGLGVAHGVHSMGSGCVCQDNSETFSGL